MTVTDWLRAIRGYLRPAPRILRPWTPPAAPATAVPVSASPQKETCMSDLTQLAEGSLSVPQFVTKVVGEINANPALKAAAGLVLALLAPVIEKAIGSSTVATAIVQDIEAGLSGQSLSAGLAGLGV